MTILDEIDPIEELHQIREMLYKKAGGTPEAYVRYVMEQQKQYADRLVDLRKPKPAQAKSRKRPAKPAAKASSAKPRSRRSVTA